MSALDQWKNYSKKLNNKVNEMFTQKKEGFSGILGANEEITNLNFNDEADAMVNIGQLTQNINTYQSAETILQKKTNEYLNKAADVTTEKRNYNVFINKHAPVVKIATPARAATSAIPSTPANTGEQCISLETLSTFVDSSNNGFDAAYPDNFTFFDKAKAACQAWAADLGYTYSGVTKEQNVFKCYTSYTPPVSSPQYTRPGVLYTVAANPNTTNGGLFSNGQIGVYRSTKNQKWDIPNMQLPLLLKHYNNKDYSSGPAPYKQAIDDDWWGDSKSDWNPSWKNKGNPWGKNLFTTGNGANAWWVGYLKNNNDLTKKWVVGSTGAIGADGTNCYFYYVYNSNTVTSIPSTTSNCWDMMCSTQGQRCDANANWHWSCNNNVWAVDLSPTKSGQVIGIYMVEPNTPKSAGNWQADIGLKINGVTIYLTYYLANPVNRSGQDGSQQNPFEKGGFIGVHTLAPGKNVFELTRPVGLPISGFVLYVYDVITKDVIFKSGEGGWGVTTSPAPDWSMVSNIPPTAQTIADPYLFKTVNNEPNGFSTCDKLIGGSINMKTINATLGKNCSTTTKKPLKARYIKISSNTSGDPVQISQLIVMAFLNGIQVNVANRGTVKSSPGIDNMDNRIPLNGKTDNKEFWSSDKGQRLYWQLDLGTEFPLTSITYYNRDVNNTYANGMTITLNLGAGGSDYNLKTPLQLTGQLVQTFNLAEEDIFYGSPNYIYRTATSSTSSGYGITSLNEAKAACEAKGQRMCKKEEISLYDSCAASWNGVEETGDMGYPMAHGDPQCVPGYSGGGQCGWCGGMQPGKPGFTPWVYWGTPGPDGFGVGGVFCCDKDHTGIFNPITTPMTY
jgi:hypothetical protein